MSEKGATPTEAELLEQELDERYPGRGGALKKLVNNSKQAAKVHLSIAPGDVLKVSANLADQLRSASTAFVFADSFAQAAAEKADAAKERAAQGLDDEPQADESVEQAIADADDATGRPKQPAKKASKKA